MPCWRNSVRISSIGAALLFGVTRTRSLVADPETVDAHFEDFLDRVLADRLDAGERENRQGLAALHHAIAELHRPFLVQQKILVDDQEDQARIHVEVPLDHGENVFAVGQQLDVFALVEVRRATEIAAVGATKPGENLARARHLPAEHLQSAHDQRMLVRHRDFRFAEQPAHEPDAFLAADEVARRA